MSKDGDTSAHQLWLEHSQSGKQYVDVIVSGQQIRVPEEDEGWPLRLLGGKNRTEIGVRRDYDPVLTLGRGQRHVPPPEAGRPGAAAGHCRSETSRGTRKGQFPLHCRSCGKSQALANIFHPEIRVFGRNLTLPETTRR